MKFLSILSIFLVLIIAIAHAAPTKRGIGSKVGELGVRFKDLYAKQTSEVQETYKDFEKQNEAFDKKIPDAAKEDGTDQEVVDWLLKWNKKYNNQVKDLKAITKNLKKSINKLNEKLHK
uniref:Nuclear factor 7, brain n=1 Tax=Anthurium amnicola TaxID=1678845 RepID=A0A1D1YHN4_9ARAE